MLFRKNAAEFHGRTQFAPTVGTFPVGFCKIQPCSGGHGFSPKTGTLLSALQTFPLSRELPAPTGCALPLGLRGIQPSRQARTPTVRVSPLGFPKKRREHAPALRILHLRLAYYTSMPSFFAARRVKSSRASRQNVKPKSAPIVTSVRKCLPIIMRVKPSSHV